MLKASVLARLNLPTALVTYLSLSHSAIAAPTYEINKISQLSLNSTASVLAQAVATPEASQSKVLDLIQRHKQSKQFEAPSQSGSISQINDLNQDGSMSQITKVSELREITPTEWAYEALRSLAERYGCIAGYPDRTFRGNRVMSRWEFAAGLNACLNAMERLIQENVAVLKEDIDKLERLAQEFKAELATLGTRVDNLEARTSFLEDHQFSTTTKLFGEVIFSIGGAFGREKAVSAGLPITEPGEAREAEGEIDNSPGDIPNNIFFSDRVRLELVSSFTGRDRLLLRLQALNTPELQEVTGTNYGRLQWDGEPGNNQVDLTIAEYLFPIGDRTIVRVAARDEMYRLLEGQVEALSPLESDANGSLSKFGRFNPLFRLGGEYPAGASITHKFTDWAELGVAYLGSPASGDPTAGFFNSSYALLTQLNLQPAETLTIGLTYAHSYTQDLRDESRSSFDFETGSKLATNPFPNDDPSLQAASANSVGGELAWQVSPNFTLASWIGYTNAEQLGEGHKAEILNWAVEFVFPDLGGEGNLGGIVVGMPPKVIGNTYNEPGEGGGIDPDTPIQIEALYRLQVTDNIAVTPGVIYIINPEGYSANDNIWVGVVRTTFMF
jgi:hypothetical protein